MTKFPEFFAELTRPIDPKYVKDRSQGGRKFSYITSRTVFNRLDEVCGPEGWSDELIVGENSAISRITITLPDGSTMTKQGVGGSANMADAGDDDKSLESDAIKRCAAKIGIGRELYQDSTVDYVGQIADKDTLDVVSLKEKIEKVVTEVNDAFVAYAKAQDKKVPKDLPITVQSVMERIAVLAKGHGVVLAKDEDWLKFFNSRARKATELLTQAVNGLKKDAAAKLA